MAVGEQRLDPVFYPRSVAVVGSKNADDHRWLRSVAPFKGTKYHVNVDRSEWPSAEALGFPSYASVVDIPDEVDYVLVSVPAAVVPRILDDCVKKGVKAVHLFTAGFGETGTAQGIELERQVVEKAHAGDIRLVGPNCLGVFNPEVGLRFSQNQYFYEHGSFAFVSQSGSQSAGLIAEALEHGLRVSKVVSMGNGLILDSPDYLDYFAEDDETQAVGMFLEGVRDHARFFDSLSKLCRRKPAFVWKVGQTEDGARAVAAHSGSVSPPPEVWDAMLEDSGAIGVDNIDDLVNTAKAILRGGHMAGPRLGLIAISGGHSTEMASVFSQAGLRVPALSEQSYERILEHFDIVGGSYRNPVEGRTLSNEANMVNMLDVFNADENIDAVVHEISVAGFTNNRDPAFFERRMKTMLEYRQRTSKPYFAVMNVSYFRDDLKLTQQIHHRLMEGGIPTFYGFAVGAKAIANAVRYHQFRAANGAVLSA